MAEKRGLGRGLSALMADVGTDPTEANVTSIDDRKARDAQRSVPIERIRPNPDQPRRTFDEDALEELAASLSAKGIIQPLIVRPIEGEAGTFEIVAGERRWRAAQMAQLHEVPIIVRDFTDTEVLEVAIVENIQREDLNPLEEALGYRQLIDTFGHTQAQMAEALGKSRSHIANLMRLLTLPDDVQNYVRSGQLSAGHARALITAADPSAIAKTIVAKGLSVREAERLAKGQVANSPKAETPKETKDADTRALEADLSAALGFKVSIDHRGDGGTVSIRYRSLEELDTLCGKISQAR